MMTTTQNKPLIAGVLRPKPIRVARAGTSPTHPGAFTSAERAEVRAAVRDGRDADERAIDHVVDRLLRELTW